MCNQFRELRDRPNLIRKRLLLLGPGRFWPQIDDEAADADSKADKRVL
jgi:hypothetical protein